MRFVNNTYFFVKGKDMSKLLIVAVVVVFTPCVLSAQDGEAGRSSQEKKIEELQKQLEQMQKQMAETQRQLDQMRKEMDEQKKAPVVEVKKEDIQKALADYEKTKLPRVEFHGLTFAQYGYEMAGENRDTNNFDVTRTYLWGLATLSDNTQARLTIDSKRDDTAGDKELEVFIKHAWVSYKGLYPTSEIKFGLVDLGWVPYMDGLWGYRFQGEVFANKTGYITSTDFGISLSGKFPEYNDYGEYHFALVNGEGYRNPENNRYKSFDGRVTFTPFQTIEGLKPWSFTDYFEVGYYDTNADGSRQDRIRNVVSTAYKTDRFMLGAEYLIAKDPPSKMSSKWKSLTMLPATDKYESAKGYSVYGAYNIPDSKFSLIARYDWLNPSDELPGDNNQRGIFGVAYKLNDSVRFLLDWDRALYDNPTGLSPSNDLKDTSTLLFQTEFKF